MLALLTGPADGPQADLASRIPARGALWIATDQEPGAGSDREVLHRLPWTPLIALTERLAFPTGTMLSISTLDGFGTTPRRPVVRGDHTDRTAELSRLVRDGSFPHDLIVLASLSGLYEDAIGTMSITAGSGSERALEAARMIAGNAIAHLCWNLRASGIATLALCWDIERTMKGKVTGEVVNAPRRIVAMADVAMRIEQGRPVVTSARENSGFSVGQIVTDWTPFLKG